ncbi:MULTISPECIES: mandelate racemase/muconate lactonizing enzyme family protein [unclassified Marinovum]
MPRIARATLATHANDIGGKLWNPAIRWTVKHAVFVVLEDDAGNAGLGECWCFDAAPDALLAFLRTEVLPHFEGAELSDVEGIAARLIDRATLTARHGILLSALSGIDLAVWDLRSRQSNLPLWQALNATGSGAVSLYASGGLYGEGKSDQDLAREMAGFAAQGFPLSKMKIGGLSISEDLARVNAVLSALPPEARLIIDGVYSYTATEARAIYEALPQGRIEAFQSPLKAYDIAGMAELSRAGVPVMALEAEYRREVHALLVHEARVAFLQTAPIASGGVTGVRALANLCSGTDTRLSLEVSSTGVALMAACHIAAAEPLVAHVEYHSVHRVFFNDFGLGPEGFDPRKFTLPATPGFGVSLPDPQRAAPHNKNAPVAFQEPHKRP